jgi:hypothetical protein
MKKFITIFIALLSFATFALMAGEIPNYAQFNFGTLTNVPAVLTNNQTATINAVIFTNPGHGIALWPSLVSTNASTSNTVISVSFARDSSLTNWSSTVRTYTNAMAGTTAIAPFIYIPVADTDATCAVRVNTLQSFDSATITVNGIPYSTRY